MLMCPSGKTTSASLEAPEALLDRGVALVHLGAIPNCQPVGLDLPPQFGRILGGPPSVQRNETSPRLRAIRSNGQKDHQILVLSSTEVAGSEHRACGRETLI
jgi:hypothetical protein